MCFDVCSASRTDGPDTCGAAERRGHFELDSAVAGERRHRVLHDSN
jgi:hypothetical protein